MLISLWSRLSLVIVLWGCYFDSCCALQLMIADADPGIPIAPSPSLENRLWRVQPPVLNFETIIGGFISDLLELKIIIDNNEWIITNGNEISNALRGLSHQKLITANTQSWWPMLGKFDNDISHHNEDALTEDGWQLIYSYIWQRADKTIPFRISPTASFSQFAADLRPVLVCRLEGACESWLALEQQRLAYQQLLVILNDLIADPNPELDRDSVRQARDEAAAIPTAENCLQEEWSTIYANYSEDPDIRAIMEDFFYMAYGKYVASRDHLDDFQERYRPEFASSVRLLERCIAQLLALEVLDDSSDD